MEVMKGWLKDARAYGVNDEEDWDKLASRRPWAAMAAILRTVKTMTIEHVQAFNIDRGGLSFIMVSVLWVFKTAYNQKNRNQRIFTVLFLLLFST